MQVIFRVDGSNALGFGHIARCRNLAEQLRPLGYEPRFVRTGRRDRVLKGQDVVWLDIEEDAVGSQRDAELTLQAAKGSNKGAPIVVVDSYQIDQAWESVVRSSGALVVAIDDLANRVHDCHVLIDANPLEKDRYRGLVAPEAVRLLGLAYALIEPESSDRLFTSARSQHVERVLVCFGGGDNRIPLQMAYEACSDPRLAGLTFGFVTASDNIAESLRSQQISVQEETRAKINVFGWVDDLRPLHSASDIAVGAGGSLALERIHLGLPSVVVSLAGNQVPTSQHLHRLGLMHYVGDISVCTAQIFADAVSALVNDAQAREMVQRNGPQIVDGYGASRCAEAIVDAHQRLISAEVFPPSSL